MEIALTIFLCLVSVFFIYNPYILMLYMYDEKDKNLISIYILSSSLTAIYIDIYSAFFILVLIMILCSQRLFKFHLHVKLHAFIIQLLLVLNIIDFFIEW